MLENKESINYILNKFQEKDPFFCEVFDFDIDIIGQEKEYMDNFFDDNEEMKKKVSHVKWLYFSNNQIATLIGILENGKIYAFDDEGGDFDLCDSFFEIPFRLFMWDFGKPSIFELFKVENEKYLINIKKYIKWLNDNNLMNNINPKYIESINKYKIKDGKTPFYYKYGQEIIEKLKNRDKVFCNVFGFINDDKNKIENILKKRFSYLYKSLQKNIIYQFMIKNHNNELVPILILNNYEFKYLDKATSNHIFIFPYEILVIEKKISDYNNELKQKDKDFIEDFKIYVKWLCDNNIDLGEQFNNVLEGL